MAAPKALQNRKLPEFELVVQNIKASFPIMDAHAIHAYIDAYVRTWIGGDVDE